MHTTEGTKYRFFHNGDYSGDIQVMNKDTNQIVEIPFIDLKRLVSSWVLLEKTTKLEQAEDDEILLR